MAPIIAPGYQITISGTVGGRPWANVFAFQLAGDPEISAEEAADLVANSWGSTVFTNTTSTTELTGVAWVDLRTLTGDSGSKAASPPYDGQDPAQGSSPQVAVMIKWEATGGRSVRGGRTFIPGMAEAGITAGGDVIEAVRTSLQGELDDYLDLVQAGGLIPSILTRTGPSAGTMRTILSGSVDPRAATQRRRQRS